MKNKISFLAIFAVALNMNSVRASECVDDDCELAPVVVEQELDTVEILKPVKYEINWLGTDTLNTTHQETTSCTYDYNCPFETAKECEIWYKKPVHKITLEPRAPHINPVLVDDMLYAIYSNCEITANDDAMSPLLQRYKILMNASNACCTSGIVYKMQKKNASESAIYRFLKDDANYFAIQRCMVMPNEKISDSYSNGVDGQMVADVRNSCLCKNRQWFTMLLQPFVDIYERNPEFADTEFTYTYFDGLKREITVSVNEDVQSALEILSACPD